MRDFMNIMRVHHYWDEGSWARSDKIYTFGNGSYIEFFSADDPAKLRGGRRDVLFMNESNNVSYEAFLQLEVRTKNLIILDFNPVAEFWVHEQVMPHTDHDFLILTYRDNEALDPNIIASIESKKHNTNWWQVYGLGQIGFNEGQIYKDWEIIDEVPSEARLMRHTMDFGYTNDPSAAVDIYTWNNAFILDEILYATNQSNRQLANAIRLSENLEPVDDANQFKGDTKILTIADSAEPKSIDEIRRYGLRIIGSARGQGSVNFGMQIVQSEKIYVTKRSLNIIKEQRNYLWKVDRDGRSLNVPEDVFNHAMDAVRYGITDLKARREIRTFAKKPSGF